MPATLWLEYDSHTAEYAIDITPHDWQCYQQGTLEPSNIISCDMGPVLEWSITIY